MPEFPPVAVAQVVEDAKRICACAAPTFQEQHRAALVVTMLAEIGVAAAADAVGNVVCSFGPSDAEAAVFAAHLDTVFGPDHPTRIVHDEATGTIAAPGIGDNSLGVAGLLALARRFAASPPRHLIVLAATVGEEGLGDLRGAKHLTETLPCRAFVAVEGAMLDSIRTSGIGSTRYRVTYRGPGGHSWGDRGTPSAVHGLVETAARFLASPAPPELARNIGRVSGGTSINTIAAEASLELDLRAEQAKVLEAGADAARSLFGQAPAGLEAELELLGQRPSGAIADDHPLVQAARRARTTAGLPPAEEGASSTDANAAHGRGIPAITVGLTNGGHAHRLDEYIELAPLGGGLAALEALAADLASGSA
jgi:tripeptide aminopeptidase